MVRVEQCSNEVIRVDGPRTIYIKRTNAAEVAVYARLIPLCNYLPSVAALYDKGNGIMAEASHAALQKKLTPGQIQAIHRTRDRQGCFVITAGPKPVEGGRWVRESLYNFSKNASIQEFQIVLSHAFNAIYTIHKAGVMHNDLHASNFLVDRWVGPGKRRLRLKIFDFDRATYIIRSPDGAATYHPTCTPFDIPQWSPGGDVWHFCHTVLHTLRNRVPREVRLWLANAIGHPQYVDDNGPVLGCYNPLELKGTWRLMDGSRAVGGVIGTRPTPLHVMFEFDEPQATAFGYNPFYYDPQNKLGELGLPTMDHCIQKRGGAVTAESDCFGHMVLPGHIISAIWGAGPVVDDVVRLCLHRHGIPANVQTIVISFVHSCMAY